MVVEREDADEFRRRIAERNATPTTEQTTSPLAWFKAHVSEIDLGEHFAGEPRPKHCNKNQKVLKHFAALERGEQSFLSHQWNWNKINAHCHCLRKMFCGAKGDYS